MKFKVTVVQHEYDRNDKDVEDLRKMGFVCSDVMRGPYKRTKVRGEVIVEINTIEELVRFTQRWGEIIVNEDTIQIYNDYVE